jgi:hypothetical protein
VCCACCGGSQGQAGGVPACGSRMRFSARTVSGTRRDVAPSASAPARDLILDGTVNARRGVELHASTGVAEHGYEVNDRGRVPAGIIAKPELLRHAAYWEPVCGVGMTRPGRAA